MAPLDFGKIQPFFALLKMTLPRSRSRLLRVFDILLDLAWTRVCSEEDALMAQLVLDDQAFELAQPLLWG